MAKLRRIDVAALLHLREDSTGNLYWRGRRLTASDYGLVFVVAALVGVTCDLIKTAIDIGSAAGWWQ